MDAFDAVQLPTGDAFDQMEKADSNKRPPLSLMQRLGAAVKGGLGDYASDFGRTIHATTAGIGDQADIEKQAIKEIPTHPLVAADTAVVEPLRQIIGGGTNLALKGAGWLAGQSPTETGQKLAKVLPMIGNTVRETSQTPLLEPTDAMKHSLALQVPGQVATSYLAPEAQAAGQLGSEEKITPAGIAAAAATELLGRGANIVHEAHLAGTENAHPNTELPNEHLENLKMQTEKAEAFEAAKKKADLAPAQDQKEDENAKVATRSIPSVPNGQPVAGARPGDIGTTGQPSPLNLQPISEGTAANRNLDNQRTSAIPKRFEDLETGPFKMVPETPEEHQAPSPVKGDDTISNWQHSENAQGAGPIPHPTPGHITPGLSRPPSITDYMRDRGIEPTPENVDRLNSQFRRAGAVPLPSKSTFDQATAALTGNIHTNEEIRRTIGSSEFEAHRQAGLLQRHQAVADQYLDTPEKRQMWVDAVEKTGKSPIPELQGLADDNRKLNEEEIAQRKEMGEEGTENLNPNHIAFMAKPTSKYVGSTRDLQGPEGYRYNRESQTRAEFEKKVAASNGGLELYSNNIAKEIQAGHADVAKSLAFRKSLQDREANGGLLHVPVNGTLPDGWKLAPDALSNDNLINTQKGTKLALPIADAKALENFQNSGKTGIFGSAANKTANGLHYLFDLVSPARGVIAEIGNLIESAARGDVKNLNPVAHYKQGYDLMTKSIDGLREDPVTKPLADGLQYISEKGGFRFDGKSAKEATLADKVNKYNPLDYLKRAADPFKVSTAARMGQYALEKVNSGTWTPEEGQNFAADQRKIIDSLFGHGKNIDTRNPELTAWGKFINPLHGWTTGAIKQVVRSTAETVQAKGNINKTSAPKLLANAMAAVGTTALAGMVLSKYYTGNWNPPLTLADVGKTGQKNPDGSDERVATASIFLPALEAIGMAAKGDPSGAVKKLLLSNPFLQPLAESIAGYDFHGNRIEGFMERAQHALAGTMPLIGRNADQSINPTSFIGLRNTPEELEDTPFQREAKEAMKQIHTSLTPEEQAQEQQKFDWQDQLSTPELQAKNGDKVVEDMAAAGYTPEQMRQVFSSAIQTSEAGHAAQRLEPGQLVKLWDKASPEEQQQMLPVLTKRWEDADKNRMTPLTKNAWGTLFDKIAPAPKGDAFDQIQ